MPIEINSIQKRVVITISHYNTHEILQSPEVICLNHR